MFPRDILCNHAPGLPPAFPEPWGVSCRLLDILPGTVIFLIMSKLYQQLRADVITAVKGRESDKALALRTADGAIQRAAIDEKTTISDALVIAVLRKAVKDLENAKEQFAKGGREDLVRKNEAELTWLNVYLPAQIDEDTLRAIVATAITESGASTPKEMGQVMGVLKRHPQAAEIDFGMASRIIRETLA